MLVTKLISIIIITIIIGPFVTYTISPVTYTGTLNTRNRAPAVIYNGVLYTFGGYTNAVSNDMQTFNIATNTWSSVTYSGTFTARLVHSATLYNNVIYAIGGSVNGAVSSDVLMYSIATNAWTTITYSGTFTARWAHSATLYNDAIYVIGGYSTNTNDHLNDVVKFTIATNTWTTVSTGLSKRDCHTATLYNGAIYVIAGGGFSGGTYIRLNDVFKFTIATSSWTTISCSGVTFPARRAHSANLYNDIIYVFGGDNNAGSAMNDIYMFTIATNTWAAVSYTGAYVGRWFFLSCIYNNDIYILTGTTSGDTVNTNEVAKFSIVSTGNT